MSFDARKGRVSRSTRREERERERTAFFSITRSLSSVSHPGRGSVSLAVEIEGSRTLRSVLRSSSRSRMSGKEGERTVELPRPFPVRHTLPHLKINEKLAHARSTLSENLLPIDLQVRSHETESRVSEKSSTGRKGKTREIDSLE